MIARLSLPTIPPRPVSAAVHRSLLRRRTRAALAGLVWVLSFAGTVSAADPGLSTRPDILNGRRLLAPVSDLAAMNSISTYDGCNDCAWQTTQTSTILRTSNLQMSDDGARTWSKSGCQIRFPSNQPFPQQNRIARIFRLPYDVLVNIGPPALGCDKVSITAFDAVQHAEIAALTTDILGESDQIENLATVAADFDGDGFDDILVMNGQGYESDNEGAFVVTASDTSDPGQGFALGPMTRSDASRTPQGEPAVGDFNGDGIKDVAWPAAIFANGSQMSVRFASVCPGAVANTICANASRFQVIFDPLSSQPLSFGTTIQTGTDGTIIPLIAVAAGRFDDSGLDTLFVAHVSDNFAIADAAYGSTYRFDGSFAPSRLGQVQIFQIANGVQALYATNARLNWFGDSHDQVVIAVGGQSGNVDAPYYQALAILTLDSALQMTVHHGPSISSSDSDGRPLLRGLAVGLFTDLSDESSSQAAFNPQVAILSMGTPTSTTACYRAINKGGNRVRIFTVDANDPNYTMTEVSSIQPNFEFDAATRWDDCFGHSMGWHTGGSLLRAGDLQGRSVRLSEPSVVRVTSHTQPFITLGAPPTHVDYVKPAEGSSSPLIVNFSALPATYVAKLDAEADGTNQSSNTQTTSYGNGYKTQEDAEVKVGVPYVEGVDVKSENAQMWTYESEVETESDTYEAHSFDMSVSTGLSDQVWFTSTEFNVYHYEVLGQTVCPQETPDCSEDEKKPLLFTFSGPQETNVETVAGATLEWYQPVHEPMQIFSYPWSQDLLEQRINDPSLLSKTLGFFTDDSETDETVEWSASQGQATTSGSVSTFSYDSSDSITAGTPNIDEEADGANLTLGYSYENSTANSVLNTNITENGAATGVTVSKPGTFLEPALYQYRVSPFIYGHTPADGTIQSIATDTSVATTGDLEVGYVADPTDENAGSWWAASPYSKAFDIALNHPDRWDVQIFQPGITQGPECLFTFSDATDVACARFNSPDPSDIWNSEFYWMRGLLVRVDGDAGPQRTQATAGDQVFLTARVYNYSLKAMPAGSKVRVRFYRQPWDTSSHLSIGNSVLIQENIVDPILPFNDPEQSDSPNWVTTEASLDTTELGGQSMLFWVVVWAEDVGGNLLGELTGHGLASRPGTLNAITDVPLESVTFPYEGHQLTTSFSNNVGFLKMAFYVAPQDTGLSSGANPARASRTTAATLRIENVDTRPIVAQLGEKVALRADVSTNQDREGVIVTIYEGDPDRGGKALDMELLGHVRKGERYHVRVPYRSQTCGDHEVLLIANRGRDDEARASVTMRTACDTPAATPTPTATPMPGAHNDGDGCSLLPTSASGGPWLLLAPFALWIFHPRNGRPPVERRG